MQFYKNLVFIIGAAVLLFGSASTELKFNDVQDGVKLTCDESIHVNDEDKEITTYTAADPSKGKYTCKQDQYFVYVNTGKNFVALETGGICGFLIASLTSTIFICIAVYSLSAQNKSRTYQASDRHPLMRNDANEAVYSHLNNEGKSTYSELAKKRYR